MINLSDQSLRDQFFESIAMRSIVPINPEELITVGN
jgi:hypothetical protein